MEPGHRSQVGSQRFTLARLKLLDEMVYGLLNELLRGILALAGALLVGGIAAERRICPVRRGIADVAAGVRHDVHSPVLPAGGRDSEGGHLPLTLSPNFFC